VTAQAIRSVQQAMSMAMALTSLLGYRAAPTVKMASYVCLAHQEDSVQLNLSTLNGSNGFKTASTY